MTCKYVLAWVGKCPNNIVDSNSDFCLDHREVKCSSCGEQATHQCDETGQFVCGAPLCENCEHTVAEDGTNGGVGFYGASSYPEGYGSHCRKDTQVYQPWYMRDMRG